MVYILKKKKMKDHLTNKKINKKRKRQIIIIK